MGIYKRGPIWWYRFTYQGQEYRGTTGETDKRRAAQAERRLRSEIERKNPKGRPARTFGLAEVGVLDIERSIAEKSVTSQVAAVRSRWRAICRILGPDTPPHKIGPAEIYHLAARLGETKRGQTVRRHLQALKRGLVLAKRQGWIIDVPDDWPTIRSDAPDEARAGQYHDPLRIKLWLRALPEDPRDEATMVLFTGLRHGELKRMTEDWVEPAPPGSVVDYVLRVPAAGAKTRTSRIVPLPPSCVEIIRRRAKRVGPDGRLFTAQSHRTAYRSAARRARIERIKLRDLRHMYATQADWLGGDRRSAQELLGHSSETMTNRYLHSTAVRLGAVANAVATWVESEILGTPNSAQGKKVEA